MAAATSASPIASSITAGTNISGSVNWTVTPARSEQFVQFYIDGALKQTDSTSPYVFNGTTTSLLDTTTLPNGPHVLGVRALFTDNRTYDFFGETVTVANPPQNTALPAISGTLIPGQTISTSTGSWAANAPPTSFTYQWEHCDSSGLNCCDHIRRHRLQLRIVGRRYQLHHPLGRDRIKLRRICHSGLRSNGSCASATLGHHYYLLTGRHTEFSYNCVGGSHRRRSLPIRWSIASGTLPTGLTLASSTRRNLRHPDRHRHEQLYGASDGHPVSDRHAGP